MNTSRSTSILLATVMACLFAHPLAAEDNSGRNNPSAIRRELLATAGQLVTHRKQQYQAGRTGIREFIEAQNQLLDIKLEIAGTPSDRTRILTQQLVLAKEMEEVHGGSYLDASAEEALPLFGNYASKRIIEGIRKDLADFGVSYDRWFSENSLYQRGAVDRVIQTLKESGHIYEKDGALWFRATALGDEKDRVVVRANGMTTYLASDLAYNQDKYLRGFDLVINI